MKIVLLVLLILFVIYSIGFLLVFMRLTAVQYNMVIRELKQGIEIPYLTPWYQSKEGGRSGFRLCLRSFEALAVMFDPEDEILVMKPKFVWNLKSLGIPLMTEEELELTYDINNEEKEDFE